MFKAEVDKSKNLVKLAFSQHVTPDETARWREKLGGLLAETRPGFKLLNDFSGLESMDLACAPDIEVAMDLCDKAGISKVVRIITDPRQDIGLNIMSLFHYRRRIPIVTCPTMEEALKALAD
jgi:hypothetical protein